MCQLGTLCIKVNKLEKSLVTRIKKKSQAEDGTRWVRSGGTTERGPHTQVSSGSIHVNSPDSVKKCGVCRHVFPMKSRGFRAMTCASTTRVKLVQNS